MRTWHKTHVPESPDEDNHTWCHACGFLLLNNGQPTRGFKAYSPCVPVPDSLREGNLAYDAIQEAFRRGVEAMVEDIEQRLLDNDLLTARQELESLRSLGKQFIEGAW